MQTPFLRKEESRLFKQKEKHPLWALPFLWFWLQQLPPSHGIHNVLSSGENRSKAEGSEEKRAIIIRSQVKQS